MKTFKVKNYKGNLIESLSIFHKSHKGMKIVEAIENGDNLKIKAEESEQKIEEAAKGNSVYVLWFDGGYDPSYVLGIYTQKQQAIKAAQKRKLIDNKNVQLREYDLDREFAPGISSHEAKYEILDF